MTKAMEEYNFKYDFSKKMTLMQCIFLYAQKRWSALEYDTLLYQRFTLLLQRCIIDDLLVDSFKDFLIKERAGFADLKKEKIEEFMMLKKRPTRLSEDGMMIAQMIEDDDYDIHKLDEDSIAFFKKHKKKLQKSIDEIKNYEKRIINNLTKDLQRMMNDKS